MDTETRSSLNSKSFLYTIRPMHLSDEPKKTVKTKHNKTYCHTNYYIQVKEIFFLVFLCFFKARDCG